MSVLTARVRSRGLVTIPKAIREANNIHEGQQVGVHDLGQGVLVFRPPASAVNATGNDLRDTLLQRGATLEGMLAELRHIREADPRGVPSEGQASHPVCVIFCVVSRR